MKIRRFDLVLNGGYRNILVENCSEDYERVDNLSSPEKIAKVMDEVFHLPDRAEEYVYLIRMTASCKSICCFEVAHGTYHAAAAAVGVREIFVRALLCGAAGIVLVHNHPVGLANPSKENFYLTGKEQGASELVGILFYDHII